MLIALFHFLRLYGIDTGWYISVEFFFITSGFLLMNTYEHNREKGVKEDSPWQYTKKRLARLYPLYLFCFIYNFIFYARLLYPTPRGKINALIASVYELLGIQMVGLNQEIYFNTVAWYVSALLITGYFIYYMVLNHRRFYVQFICPLSIIIIYSFYYREYTGIEMWGNNVGFWRHDALLRALAGMNLGILSYRLCDAVKKINFTKLGEYLLDIVETGFFLSIIAYTALVHNTDNDYSMLIFMAVAVALSFGHRKCNGIFNNKVIRYLSGLTYSIYLNHAILLSVIGKFMKELNFVSAATFFVLLFVLSVVSDFIVKKAVLICKNVIKPKLIAD